MTSPKKKQCVTDRQTCPSTIYTGILYLDDIRQAHISKSYHVRLFNLVPASLSCLTAPPV